MTDEIVAKARLIAGVEGEDELLSLYVEGAENYVLEYCRLDMIPAKLYEITAMIAADAYKRSDHENIVSLKEGDRQINYSVFDSVTEGFAKKLRPFVNYRGRVPSEVHYV